MLVLKQKQKNGCYAGVQGHIKDTSVASSQIITAFVLYSSSFYH